MVDEIRAAIDRYIDETQVFRLLMENTTSKVNYYMGFADLELKILSKSSTGKEELKKARRLILNHEALCREKTLIASNLLRKYYEFDEDEINIGSNYVDIWKGFTFLNGDGDIKSREELVQSISRVIDKWNIERRKNLKLSNLEIIEAGIVPLIKEMEDIKKVEMDEKKYEYKENEDGQLILL